MRLDRKRIERILEGAPDHLSLVKANMADPIKDRDGGATEVVASNYARIGFCEYLLHFDAASFRRNYRESVSLELTLLERCDAGEPTCGYATMVASYRLFDILAAADFDLARRFAAKLGDRPKLDEEVIRFTLAVGYSLKYLVLDGHEGGDPAKLSYWLEEFDRVTKRRAHADFAGHCRMMRAIADQDAATAQAALPQLLEGHVNQCTKGDGMFFGLLQEYLCVWGVGLVNLARHRGLDVRPPDPEPASLLVRLGFQAPDRPLIPSDLLI